jgi:ribosomal protein L9
VPKEMFVIRGNAPCFLIFKNFILFLKKESVKQLEAELKEGEEQKSFLENSVKVLQSELEAEEVFCEIVV